MTDHRVHVWPLLRVIGSFVVKDWLAITIGRRIYAWRPLEGPELEHELEHVRQWARHGLAFPILYAADSMKARRGGKRWYQDNRFEMEAREVAARRTHTT
ncbi:MAG: hypothetical protein ABIY36_03365 [Candidatus Limnocylindria bacterium]